MLHCDGGTVPDDSEIVKIDGVGREEMVRPERFELPT